MRKFIFLWVVVLLGVLMHSQEAASQEYELEPLEGLQSGLTPLQSELEPLENTFAPVDDQQVVERQKAEEERARWFRINQTVAANYLILEQRRREQTKRDSLAWVTRMIEMSGGVGIWQPFPGQQFKINFPVNGSELERFMWAMAHKKESGGRYDAYNPSGAYGKYQYLPSTWNNAAREYSQDTGIPLSLVITQDAFNQERVTRHQMTKLFGQYGNWRDVASVWFSGKPYYAHKNPGAVKDAMGTTVQNYCDTILRAMQTGQ